MEFKHYLLSYVDFFNTIFLNTFKKKNFQLSQFAKNIAVLKKVKFFFINITKKKNPSKLLKILIKIELYKAHLKMGKTQTYFKKNNVTFY